ncbi:MAG: hypothetical protein NT015_05680 [Alphaproteobacteria bacterium]|nr:hypothetical protein [Alphaproteobacteria bacterium]
MKADGVDPKELTRRLEEADLAGRVRLIARYKNWIVTGARAQGLFRYGFFLLALSAFFAVLLAIRLPEHLWLCALCVPFVLVGGWLSSIASRRESEWRRAHPFTYEDTDAQVLRDREAG